MLICWYAVLTYEVTKIHSLVSWDKFEGDDLLVTINVVIYVRMLYIVSYMDFDICTCDKNKRS